MADANRTQIALNVLHNDSMTRQHLGVVCRWQRRRRQRGRASERHWRPRILAAWWVAGKRQRRCRCATSQWARARQETGRQWFPKLHQSCCTATEGWASWQRLPDQLIDPFRGWAAAYPGACTHCQARQTGRHRWNVNNIFRTDRDGGDRLQPTHAARPPCRSKS